MPFRSGRPAAPAPNYRAPPPPKPAPSLDNVVHNQQMRVSSLDARIRQLDTDLASYKREMQRLRPGSASHNMYKKRALQALKKKRMLENQASQVMNQQFNMDQVRNAAGSVKDAKDTMAGLESMNKQMRKEMKSVNIDKLEDVQDSMEDILQDTEEIQESLGRSYMVGDQVDDEELEAELDGIEQDLFAGDSLTTPSYLQPAGVGAQSSGVAANQQYSTPGQNSSQMPARY